MPVVQQALESIAEGGYPEAVARVGALLTRGQATIPLAQIELRAGLMEDYAALLPKLSQEERRRIRGQQEVIVAFEPNGPWRRCPRSSPIRPTARGY